MDQTQDKIEEYFDKLPQKVQDIISDNIWEQRTGEVAKKYLLNPEQTDSLINIVALTLSGLEKPENFLGDLTSDLTVSKLIAEQIMSDLEKRVFEYALNQIEVKNKPETEKQPEKKAIYNEIPEIRPQNLPAKVVFGSKIEPEISVPKYAPQINNAPKISPIEPVQKPMNSAPIVTINPIKQEIKPEMKTSMENSTPNIIPSAIPPAVPKPDTPKNVMDNKLKNVTLPNYSSDPYREPLE